MNTQQRKALPEMEKKKIDVKDKARIRVQRYRAIHRRIDYAPSPKALSVIKLRLAAGLDCCIAGVIDQLIEAGDKAMPGYPETS